MVGLGCQLGWIKEMGRGGEMYLSMSAEGISEAIGSGAVSRVARQA